MLFSLGAEAKLVDLVDDFAEVVAALDFVFDFAEDFADLIFDRVGARGALLEAGEVGKELEVDEVAEIVAGRELCCGRPCRGLGAAGALGAAQVSQR